MLTLIVEVRWIDPYGLAEFLKLWRAVDEAFWMILVRDEHLFVAYAEDCVGIAVVDIFRSKHGDSAVAMLGVIPIEERTTEAPSVFLRAESLRKSWHVLHRFEVTLRIRIVVGNVRSAMTLGGSQICQELSNPFGSHRRPAIRMDDQLARLDLLFLAGIGNEAFGKGSRFPAR